MKLDENMYLCVGQAVGSDTTTIITKPIGKWKEKRILLEKKPIIYLLGSYNEEN
jgi:hypothetical protein